MKDSVKTIVLNEAVHLKKFLILLFVVLTMFSAITIAMFATSVAIPKQFNDILVRSFEDGTDLILKDNCSPDKLFGYGADYITLTASEITRNIRMDFNGKSLVCSGEAQYFMNEFNRRSYFFNEDDIISAGRKWTKEDNNKYFIWISESVAAELNLSAGDDVNLNSLLFKDSVFNVKGIYKNSDISYTSDFIFSFDIAQILIKEDIEISILLDIYDIFKTPKIINELRKNNLEYLDLDGVANYINANSYMNGLFWALTIILLIATGFVLFNFLSMIINSREKFYGLIKTLGLTTKQLMFVCFFLILIISIIAIVLGSLLSIPLNNYFSELATNISGLKFKVQFLWYVPPLYFILNIFLFYILFIFTKRRFKGISPLVILNDEN